MKYCRQIGYYIGLSFVVLLALSACVTLVPASPPPTGPVAPPSIPVPDVTVCADGCDFTTIRAALDVASTIPGSVIGVRDTVHTEAGIVVDKNVTIQGQGAGAS